ncbi:hypothetical protein NMY22_g1440 [Coprinellus aureogranulatus]|nr:hypothetical protein NMY22_g1440 [Coprinellus aureogranulatus]
MSSNNSSIDVLSPELLEKVFLECVPYPTSDNPGPSVSRNHPAVVLSHVCHEWRTLSLNNPMLWSRMHIRLPSSSDIPEHKDWCNAMGGLASVIEIWIERSALCLITVVLDLQASRFELGGRSWITQVSAHDDYVCIPRSIFKSSKRWKELSINIDCDGSWGPLAAVLDVCKEHPSPAYSFPNLEALSIQITVSSAVAVILHGLSSSLMQTALFSAPSLRRLSTKGRCKIRHSRSLKEWGRGCSLLTELCIDPPNDIDGSRPGLFGPSDALRLLEAIPSLTRASFGLQAFGEAGLAIATPTQVIAPHLVSLSLHGVPMGSGFARTLVLPSLSHLALLFYPWIGRNSRGTLLTSPTKRYANGIREFLSIFGRQLKGLALNPAPLTSASLSSCLDFLDSEKLETLSFVPNHFPAQQRQAVYGFDTDAVDVRMDALNCTALAYIGEPSVFPNLKRFEMNVYNASRDDACSRALLEVIASRRGGVEDVNRGEHGAAELGPGDNAPNADDFVTSSLTHGLQKSQLQDVHLVFSTYSTVDIVKELTDKGVDLGFNLRLDYPDIIRADWQGTSC